MNETNDKPTVTEDTTAGAHCPWCGTPQRLDADGLVPPHEHPTYGDDCPGTHRRPSQPNDDTTAGADGREVMNGDEAVAMPRVERDNDGRPRFIHACTNVPVHSGTLPLSRETGWWWADDDTLMPSIHCHRCGTHGWWRNGQWEAV